MPTDIFLLNDSSLNLLSTINKHNDEPGNDLKEKKCLEALYYVDKHFSESVFSSEPPGNLNVDRFLQNKPFWQTTLANTQIKTPKTLILADWRASNWDSDQIENIKKTIHYLLAKEFLIYAWQSGRLMILDEHNSELLSDEAFKEKMTPISSNQLIALANRKLQLTHNQIHILDDYFLDYLSSESNIMPCRQLKVSELNKHDNKIEILSLLKNAVPPLTTILHTALDTTHDRTKAICMDECQDVVIENKFLSLTVTLAEIHDGLVLRNFNSDDLSTIEVFFIDDRKDDDGYSNALHIENLTQLLKKMPKLKSINIVNCNDIESILMQVNFPYLKILSVYDSTFNVSDSHNIPSLSYLKLKRCVIKHIPKCLNVINMKLSDCTIESDQCINLFEGNDAIRKLSISETDCTNLNFISEKINILNLNDCIFSKIINFSFPCLSEISIAFLDVSPHLFNSLFSSAKKIKKVSFEGCDFHKEINFKGYVLSDLIELSISHYKYGSVYNVSFTSFFDFISGAVSLEKLSIYGEFSNKNERDLNLNLNLNRLKSIYLNNSNISSHFLSFLLEKGTNIEVFHFNNSTNLDFDLLNEGRFLQLKDLDLSGTRISGLSFNKLFSHSQKVKSITLINCDRLDIGNISECDFPDLRHIKLSHSSITRNNFISIVKNSKKIKTIDLSNCRKFNNECGSSNILYQSFNFQQITSFNGDLTNISTEDLSCILNKTKELEVLSLGFTALGDDIDLNKVESICLNKTQFTDPSQLEDLFRKTPNLEVLTINNTCNWPNSIFKKPIYLPSLCSFEISSSSMSINMIIQIIESAEQLNNLNIDRKAHGINSTKSYDHSLNVSNDNDINTSQLQYIINKMRYIDYLSIFNCSNMQDNFVGLLMLDRLNNIAIHNSNLGRHIEYILERCRNLNAISLFNNKELPTVFSKPLFLPNLSRMFMMNCNIKQPSNLTPQEVSRLECDSLYNICAKINKVGDGEKQSNLDDDFQPSFMDASTALIKDQSFSVKRIFFPVGKSMVNYPVKQYRKTIYEKVVLNNEPSSEENVFILYRQKINTNDFILSPYNLRKCTNLWSISQALEQPDSYQYGRQDFYVTSEWQAIASLSPNEIMTHYQISNHADSVQIAYSNTSNRYYIKTVANPHYATLDFIIRLPAVAPYTFSQKFNYLLQYVRGFQPGSLVITVENPKGADYFNAMYHQRIGACRHRSALFMLMCQQYLPVRLITNDCHAYVEVKCANQWVTFDLGGYPACLEVTDTLRPLGNLDKVQTESISQVARPIVEDEAVIYWQHGLTAKNTPTSKGTLEDYYHSLLAINSKTQLIELQSSIDVKAMQMSLQQYCQQNSYPLFYIHKPEDLICSAPFLRCLANGIGQLEQGPSGLLYDFLNKVNNFNAIILVNYDNFKADDIVRFNSLLDKRRKSDGIDLPDSVKVIGLININNPDCYQGSDFYSRFDTINKSPPAEKLLSEQARPLPIIKACDNHLIIPLYHANDWKERLLGRWIIQRRHLVFVEGALPKALETGKPIALQNAPCDNPDFEHFWRQALLSKQIKYPAGILAIPDNLQIACTESYNWEDLKHSLIMNTEVNKVNFHVLNPTVFNQFFTRYVCDNDNNQLMTEKGLIEMFAGQNLFVNLTRSINADQWAMLLARCQEFQVTLQCYCSRGVDLPDSLQIKVVVSDLTAPIDVVRVLISNDVDTSLSMLSNNEAKRMVIDVSECLPSDLLGKLDGTINLKTLAFDFKHKTNFLQCVLDKNTVILKGRFSSELVDSLAALLLGGCDNLTVISEETDLFNFMPHHRQTITIDDKKSELLTYFPNELIGRLNDDLIERSALSQLLTRLRYWQQHPKHSSDQAWQGLLNLPVNLKFPAFDETRIVERCANFTNKRHNDVQQMFNYTPYVFLTGLTGVGKTTFVQELSRTCLIYQGDNQLEAWASDRSEQQKILFIDEANLSQHNRSNFEGLFHRPAGMLINGTYHFLMPTHKVIFAGNPLSYGQGRQLASLFTRHGNALIFDPMPPEYIYQHIIKPVFDKSQLPSKEVITIAKALLNVYVFTVSFSQTEVLLSPRDIQMMALLVASYHHSFPDVDVTQCANYYAWFIARQAVSHPIKRILDQHFATQAPHSQLSMTNDWSTKDFLITPSRYPLVNTLHDLLALRALRQNNLSHSAIAFGGLGGIILEGNSGIGKSELVRHCLRDYQKVDVSSSDVCLKAFYEMPVSMSNDDKNALLLKAFDEGAIVIIDEINSAPMMEQTLNALLMGHTPGGKRPNKPGFMVIGTQNPVTMAGRQKPSSALARRLITTILPDYSDEEMTMILGHQGISRQCADHMIKGFNHLNQAPSRKVVFRDLIKMASSPEKLAGYQQIILKQLIKALYHKNNHQNSSNSFFNDTQLLDSILLILSESNDEFFLQRDNQQRPFLCLFFNYPQLLHTIFQTKPYLCEKIVNQNLGNRYFMWHAFHNLDSLKLIIDFLPNESVINQFLAARVKKCGYSFYANFQPKEQQDEYFNLKRARPDDEVEQETPAQKRHKDCVDETNNLLNQHAILTYKL